MTLQVGNKMPDAELREFTSEGVQEISTSDLFAGRKVVLFAVPGAFTPGCSEIHLPGFVVRYDDLKAGGVEEIICMAVNDAFVMTAWGRDRNASDYLRMLADGNGDLVRAMGLELDASRFGMGKRSKRFAAIIDDGVVKYLGVEPAGEVGVSSADAVLAAL